MITAPQNTRFIESVVAPLGPNPYPGPMYPGGMGEPNNNDYYPVANGPVQSTQTSDQIRWVRCVDMLWQYEDLVFRPVMTKILAAWAQYNNLYDSDTDKDDWQSKKATPFMFLTLERLAGAFVQFIEQKPGWFKGEASVPPMQLFVDLVTKFLGWWLKHDLVDFFSKFEEMMKSGLMTGHVHVTVTVEQGGIPIFNQEGPKEDSSGLFTDSLWSQLSPFLQDFSASNGFTGSDSATFPFIANPNMPRLCFQVIPTSSVRLDSTGRDRYKMWKTVMGVGEFMMTAAARGWNLQACRDCIGGHSRFFDQEMNYLALQQGVARTQENIMHMVELLHFEGDLHDPQTGEPLFQKSYMVVANGRQVVYGPSPMPFWDGESIMISAPFVKNTGAVYGKSFLPESVDMMDVRHDLMNVLLDYIRRVLQPPMQVDRSILEDRAFNDEHFAMYPGKVIFIRGNGQANAQAVVPCQTPDLPVGFWQYMQYFQSNQQEMTGMSQELMGSPRTRLRTTGMEQDSQQAQAGKFLEAIWAGLERRLLSPLLRLSCLRLFQYLPTDFWTAWVRGSKSNIFPSGQPTQDPQLQAQWAAQLDKCSTWDAKTLFKYLGGFFSWNVSIFNNLSQRQAEIEKVTMFLNVLAKIPGAFQVARLPYFIKKLTEAFGWDPSEALMLQGQPIPDMGALDSLDPQALLSGEESGGNGAPSTEQSALDAFIGSMSPPVTPKPMGSTFPGGPRGPVPNPVGPPPGSIGGAP